MLSLTDANGEIQLSVFARNPIMLKRYPERCDEPLVDYCVAEPTSESRPRENLLGQIVLMLCFIIAILLRSLS
ncbi:hypothetical protein RRSWK_03874 [Rhodopirellula sp. SWK7]|nr:hypothetical protein RRSWK_03874 [Rhodopirellula sp. SWK7]